MEAAEFQRLAHACNRVSLLILEIVFRKLQQSHADGSQDAFVSLHDQFGMFVFAGQSDR